MQLAQKKKLMTTKTKATLTPLFIATTAILLIGLGARELWSLETRWANIVIQMIQSQDYWHPFLKGESYYDKPLLSYWLMIATSKVMGSVSTISLRLPSVFSALASVYFIYTIGTRLFDKQTGLIAGWLLSTTFYFIFWGRVASADMLNVAGMLAAIAWFFRDPEKTTFWNYVVFFQIIALTCLCKGLLGLVLPGLILMPYLIQHHLWQRHLNIKLFLAIIPAIVTYLIPFFVPSMMGEAYQSTGLDLVIKENVTRFIAPFDHKNPIYTYFIYLPVFTLPWTPLFIAALIKVARHWKEQAANTQWLVWVLAILFVFFTASGSRRSYYVLPLVPFAQLLCAVLIKTWVDKQQQNYLWWLRASGLSAAIVYAVFFGIALPWYYAGGGLPVFGQAVKEAALKQAPWDEWHIVMIDIDNKVPFYVQTSSPFTFITSLELEKYGKSAFKAPPPNRTIFLIPARNEALLQPYLAHYKRIESTPTNGERFFSKKIKPTIAFVP
jgi:4-amino-4-deoxy-L-arabinose transferase-like glycosyltransferase